VWAVYLLASAQLHDIAARIDRTRTTFGAA
jgi:hypothetical protein